MSDEYDFDAPDHCTVGRARRGGPAALPLLLPPGPVRDDGQGREATGGGARRLPRAHRQGAGPAGPPARGPRSSTAPRSSSGSWGPSASPTTRSSTGSSWCSKRWASRTRTRTRTTTGERARAPRRPHPRAGGRLRHPCHAPGRGGPPALPAVLAPAGPRRARLPAHQRAPAAGDLAAVSDAEVERVLTEGDMEVHGRIAGSSNATLLVTCRLAGRGAARRLQAVQGRAAPVGLPRWALPS